MCLYPRLVINKKLGRAVKVSCGKCIECESMRANEWSVRLMLEAREHTSLCYVTLTYNEEHLPADKSVSVREMQLFIKRLRKHISPIKIRYFYCGEYGSERGRPHYHIIIFGWSPSDLRFFKMIDGIKYYTSIELEKIWQNGFCLTSSELTLQNTRYCAKYLQKLKPIKDGRQQPFIKMSNRPGIGSAAFDYRMLDSDSVFYQGRKILVPRYFLKLAERSGEYDLDLFRLLRQSNFTPRSEMSLVEARKKAKEIFKKI